MSDGNEEKPDVKPKLTVQVQFDGQSELHLHSSGDCINIVLTPRMDCSLYCQGQAYHSVQENLRSCRSVFPPCLNTESRVDLSPAADEIRATSR